MTKDPNVGRLIAHKMAVDAVPAGGGLASCIGFLSDKEKILSTAKAATIWVGTAIRAVREAAEPNPWRQATDEEIAGEILRQIADRKKVAK